MEALPYKMGRAAFVLFRKGDTNIIYVTRLVASYKFKFKCSPNSHINFLFCTLVCATTFIMYGCIVHKPVIDNAGIPSLVYSYHAIVYCSSQPDNHTHP